MRGILTGLVPPAVLLASVAYCGETNARYEDGKLWVEASSASTSELFTVITDATGVRFLLDEVTGETAPIDLRIEAMDLEQGIESILKLVPEVAGHTMVYTPGQSDEARLTDVVVFRSEAPSPHPASAMTLSAQTASGESPGIAPDEPEGEDRPTVSGTVKWFNTDKGYGFITTDEGKEVFVHYTSIVGDDFRTLKRGQRVRLKVGEPQALRVMPQ